MKKIFLLLFSLPILSIACDGYVIGFKGINNIFDNQAFSVYANNVGYCKKSYAWNEYKSAANFIKEVNKPYHLYGYSKGASSITKILKFNIPKPEFIITIGAYKTTMVNFSAYNVDFINFFDASGKGQSSPGIFLDISHDKIQHKVNEIYFRRKS